MIVAKSLLSFFTLFVGDPLKFEIEGVELAVRKNSRAPDSLMNVMDDPSTPSRCMVSMSTIVSAELTHSIEAPVSSVKPVI